jgi:hypothetical protein
MPALWGVEVDGRASDAWSLPKANTREKVKKEMSGRIVADDRVCGVPRADGREGKETNPENKRGQEQPVSI